MGNDGEKLFWWTLKRLVVVALFILAVYITTLLTYDPSLDKVILEKNIHDSIEAAAQLGRLDIVSALLGILGILLAIFGMVGYSVISFKSEQISRKTAEKESREEAREHLTKHLPDLVQKALRAELQDNASAQKYMELAAQASDPEESDSGEDE